MMGGALAFSGILVGIVLALYAGAILMRRKLGIAQNTLPQSALRIVGRRNLDRHRAIYVVEVGDRYILVGGAEGSLNLLDHVSKDEFELISEREAEAARLRTSTATKAADQVTDAFTTLLTRARRFHDVRAERSTDEPDIIEMELSASERT